MIILKALVWKNPLSPEIVKIISPADFSPNLRKVYAALINMFDIGIDIKAKTLQDALESDVQLPLFDHAPRDKDVSACLEMFRQKVLERRKAVEKIMEWKQNIDNLTHMVNDGDLEPRVWLERMSKIMPAQRPEEKSRTPERIELATNRSEARGSGVDMPPEGSLEREPDGGGGEEKKGAPPSPIVGALEPSWGMLLKEFEKGEGRELTGLSSGLEALDRKTMGLKGLIAVAGTPKMGKTTLALQLATDVARVNNALSIYYSLEMDRQTLMYRLLARISQLPFRIITLGQWSALKEKDLERYRKAKKHFDTFKNKLVILDRASTEVDSDKMFYQIDGLIKKTKKEKVFIVIDTLPSLAILGEEEGRYGHSMRTVQAEKILGKFRLIQKVFGATILFIYPKNFIPLMVEKQNIPEPCYDLVYAVDSFFEMMNKTEMYNKADFKGSLDYYNEMVTQEEEIDLWSTSRDTGQWFLPLTFIKAYFTFAYRKSGFKATKISWQPPEDEEDVLQ
jgi:replicative DNA helicase